MLSGLRYLLCEKERAPVYFCFMVSTHSLILSAVPNKKATRNINQYQKFRHFCLIGLVLGSDSSQLSTLSERDGLTKTALSAGTVVLSVKSATEPLNVTRCVVSCRSGRANVVWMRVAWVLPFDTRQGRG